MARALAVVLGFLFLVQLATLSRSGLLGLGVGLCVLAIPVPAAARVARAARAARGRRALLAPSSGPPPLLRGHPALALSDGGTLESAHFARLRLRPADVHSHPLFGLGLNTFSVYYEFVTGRTNWGPHSFYVALIVETGLVGARVLRSSSGTCSPPARGAGDWAAARRRGVARHVRPLAWGMTAALAGTMAANLFYLTMIFYSFYAFASSRSRCRSCSARRERVERRELGAPSDCGDWLVVGLADGRGRRLLTSRRSRESGRLRRGKNSALSYRGSRSSRAATACLLDQAAAYEARAHACRRHRDLSRGRTGPRLRHATPLAAGARRAVVAVLPDAAASIVALGGLDRLLRVRHRPSSRGTYDASLAGP